MWRWFIVWGSTLACAALTWTIWPTSPIGLCLVSFAAIVGHSLTVMLYDGLARARERASLSSKVKSGVVDQSELPPKVVNIPYAIIAVGVLCWIGVFLLAHMLGPAAGNTREVSILLNLLCVGMGGIALFATLYAILKIPLWLIIQSTEIALAAAEALRRRKLKETIYADSDSDPLEVSDLQGDVSVGDDGEIDIQQAGQ
jgi:hypothetical protein